MKRALLLAFFISTLHTSAQIWCTPGSVWHYNFVSGRTKHTYLYDTLISGQLHNKIRVHNLGRGRGSYNNYYTIYTRVTAGAVFQGPDTVFLMNPAIGQQWRIKVHSTASGPPSCTSLVTVLDTGHLVLQGLWLKWIKVTVFPNFRSYFPGPDTIIERIGFHRAYPFSHDYDCYPAMDDDRANDLRCFSDNQISDYRFHFTQECDYHVFTSIPENGTGSDPVEMYPNPCNGELMLTQIQDRTTVIAIHDLHGKELRSFTLPYSGTFAFTIRDLPDGIYSVRFPDTGGRPISKKLVILK